MASRFCMMLAQHGAVMGDLSGNAQAIRSLRQEAAEADCDLVICPEFGLVGYPPDDLILKPAVQARARQLVHDLAEETADGGPALLLGGPWLEGGRLYNAALLLGHGRVLGWRAKHLLPDYGVFDDRRVFAPGPVPGPMALDLANGTRVRLGVMVCEDMWTPDVSEGLAESGAEILIGLNASPFERDKHDQRLERAVARVIETGLPFVMVNATGGQDEIVFDGMSFVLNADRSLAVLAPAFEPASLVTTWREGSEGTLECVRGLRHPPLGPHESVYRALMQGLSDYVRHNGFPGVVLGLSGGIDSALSAAIAVDALGAERVRSVMLPSRYTSPESIEDARESARLLGIRLDILSIEACVDAAATTLAPLLGGPPAGLTEENLQARLRAVLLMAFSNETGAMVLTTGNKSEMSVGYATLYGDMSGGFNVLKDVYKTEVYALARWRNAHAPAKAAGPSGPAMPLRSIEKPPSAELRPDQTDADSLPPYDILDAILAGLIEADRSPDELVAAGFDRDDVVRIAQLLERAEYKRRQAPPGVKITAKAFGRDRRYPITNAWHAQLPEDGSS